MQKTYEESLRLVTRDCDMFGRWRPSAALEAMQEAAGTHAALLGVGREELIRAHNVVWVLSRAALTLARCPAIGERVTVETFPHPCLRFFYPRYFVFYDEARPAHRRGGHAVGAGGPVHAAAASVPGRGGAPCRTTGTSRPRSSCRAPCPSSPGRSGCSRASRRLRSWT